MLTSRRLVLVFSLLILLLLVGCGENKKDMPIKETKVLSEVKAANPMVNDYSGTVVLNKSTLKKSTTTDERVKYVSLNSVGDLMVHRTQIVKADRGEKFDFVPSFYYVKDILSSADYTIGNLETTLAGPLGQRRINVDQFYKGYSGYPCFNAPDAFGEAIKDSGFDLVSTANNHSFDSKTDGITRTLDVLDELGIEHVGTYRSIKASEELKIVEVNGITFGFINYTYGLNGFVLEEEEAFRINHLSMYHEDQMKRMYESVNEARGKADFIIVMLHYGNEYVIHPDKYYQKPIVDQLFASGADIILGGHPHVLQPIEVRNIVDNDGNERTGIVIYSLGNFLSSQRRRPNNKGTDTDIGGVFNIRFKQVDHHDPLIDSIRFMPTYTYWASDGIKVIPAYNPPEELAYSFYDKGQLDRANDFILDHMSSYHEEDWYMEEGYLRMDIDSYIGENLVE